MALNARWETLTVDGSIMDVFIDERSPNVKHFSVEVEVCPGQPQQLSGAKAEHQSGND